MKNRSKRIIRMLPVLVMCILLFLPGVDVRADQRTVDHNKPLQVGEYMEPVEGYTFTTNEKKLTKEYDKFILKAEADMYISDGFVDTISDLMDIIEETTGLSFMPTKSPLTTHYFTINKVVVDIGYSKMTEYGSTIQFASEDGVHFLAEDAMIGELSYNYNTLVHELLHVIQIRNYGFMGDVVTEGFAESYTGTIEKKLREKYGSLVTTDERTNEISCINAYGINECGLDVDYNTDWVTRDNIEEYFFLNPGHQGHETSYWIVEYIREKYKNKGFTKVMKALANRSIEYMKTNPGLLNLPNELELEVIKATLSESFVDDFYDWFKQQDFEEDWDEEPLDLTGVKKVVVGYSVMTSYNGNPYYDIPGCFTYKDSIEFDLSKVIAHSQQFLAIHYKGFAGYFLGDGVVSFYDQYGTLLYTLSSRNQLNDYLCDAVLVPYATKIVISLPGTHTMHIYGNSEADYFSDVVFDDLTCTDGRTVTFEEIKQREKPTKPLNVKVKTAEALAEALDEAIEVGGKITITKNITVTDYLLIPSNTQVVIQKGKKLTIKDYCIDINGTLSGGAGSVVFDGGWLWLNENSTLKIGKVTYSTKVRKDFPDSVDYSCSVRLEQGHGGKLRILLGGYNRLYIEAPKGKDVSSMIEFAHLRDGFVAYFNGKKLSAKTIKKLSN